MQAGLKRWFGRVPDLSAVIARFPIAVAFMAIFTFILIVTDQSQWDDEPGRTLAGLIIAAYVSVSITLGGEANGHSKRYVLQGVVAAAILTLAWFSEALRLNLVMAVGAVILLLGNMVIWRKSRNDLHVWDFTHKLWTGAIFAIFGSIIFLLGIMAIQAALKSLFGLRIDDLSEHLILPIGLGFLAPLYWMSTLPAVDEPYEELYEAPGFVSKAVAFLGTWLLAPLTMIYAVIILAYGVKIILAGSLPKGEIAKLVTPFLIVGTLTWLLLEPPFVKRKMLAKVFRKLWFLISIPAALLLAIAVFTRVNEYGLTPERVALIFAVLWSLGLGGWFSFGPKEKRDIRLIPALASILLIIGVFTAGGLSILNQSNRLDSYLAEAGITAGMQRETKNKLAARKAKSAIQYLYRNDAKDRLKTSLTKVGYNEKTVKLDDVYASLALTDIKSPSRYDRHRRQNQQYHRNKTPINVAGYNELQGLFHHSLHDNSHYNRTWNTKVTNIDGISVSRQGKAVLTFKRIEAQHETNHTLDKFDLSEWVEGLQVEKRNDTKIVLKKNVVPIYSDEQTQISLVMESLNRWQDDDGYIRFNISYYLLGGPAQK